jgi:hypothetical protein
VLHLPDSELERARGAGLSDRGIVEIVATVVLNIFMNYLDHVAGTAVDFPEVNRGLPKLQEPGKRGLNQECDKNGSRGVFANKLTQQKHK